MAHLSIKLLGSFEILLDNQPVIQSLGNKPRALLAYLAIEADRPHSREALAELLWPDVPASAARASLSQALTTLRDVLPVAKDQPPYILATRTTLQFNRASDYMLDIDLLERAHIKKDEAQADDLQSLSEAMAAYRGAFLDGFSVSGSETFEEWQLLQRETLQRLALETLQHFTAIQLERGHYEAAISAAQRQLEIDAWREEAHQQLMQAYARMGRRSDALAQFEKCKQVLQDELHIAPSARTKALVDEIRKGEWPIEPRVTRPPFETRPTAQAHPSSLPISLTPFIGREGELAQLTALIADPRIRLITLVGVGGIGKTRLAIEAVSAAVQDPAAQGALAHEVTFVPLAALTTSDQIAPAISSALSLTLDGEQAPLAQLLQLLRDKHTLLVLDNFEQLLPDGAEIVGQILQQAHQVKLLITSREALQLTGESMFEVNGMGDDAVTLFVQAARRAQAALRLSIEDLSVVEQICKRVGEMPLAVELAGSWMRTLSCQEIADEIERDIDFLESNLRDTPERHRSIRAVCDSTWKMLSAQEQRVMQALSIFAGGFTYEAAKAVAETSIHVLSSLVAKSLVQRVQHSRYNLHPVIQRYSAAKLAEDAAMQSVAQQHHLAFYQQLAHTFAAQALGADMLLWMNVMEREKDNLQTALDFAAQTESATFMQLLLDALEFLYHRDPYRGYQWIQQALNLLQKEDTALTEKLRVRVLLRATHLITEPAKNEALAREALALAQQGEDDEGIAEALRSIAANMHIPERLAETLPLFEESARLFTALDNKAELYDTLSLYAKALHQQGYMERAGKIATHALGVARELNSPIMIAHGLSTLSGLAQDRGDLAQAIALGEEAAHIFEHSGSKRGTVAMLAVKGNMALWEGNYVSAQHYLEQAKILLDDLGTVAEKRNLLDQLEHLNDLMKTQSFGQNAH